MTKDELVVPRSLASDDLLGAAADLGVTAVSWTPTLFRRLLLLGGRPALSSLSFEQVTFGGEAASQDVLDAARRLWPTARVTHTLASAEWGDICATSDGLAGYPAEKLATGRAVVAASGELLVDGVPTGDVWRREGDRYHFVGRTGDIVTVASEQVSLHEVAAAAKRVSGVVEAVADVISNPVAGSLVVLDYEGAVEPSVVRSALRTLPRAAWPASIRQVEHLHPTEAGKAPSSATTKGQAEI